MSKSLFYSWQSQLPGKHNRYLIEGALERVQKELAGDASTHFTIEQDARGVVGAPEISSAILAKIERSNIFVADVTPVGKLVNGKSTPNPNVLFELGYFWRELGEQRVLLVLNEAYGVPEELPFDISKRGLVRYRCDDASVAGDVRKVLTAHLKAAVLAMLHEEHLGVLRKAGLSISDLEIFSIGYSEMVEQNDPICAFDRLLENGAARGRSETEVVEATQIISDKGFWNASPAGGPHDYSHVQLTALGFEQYCKAFIPGYANLPDEIGRRILDGETESDVLATATGQSGIVVEHVLELLEQNDYIRVMRMMGGMAVLEVKPQLKRQLEQKANR